MTGQILFFTDKSVGDLVKIISEGSGTDYDYNGMKFNSPGLTCQVIPEMMQYALWPGANSRLLFDLAREHLRKIGGTFIVLEVCLGYPIPPLSLMPEEVLDLKDHVSGEWPQSLLDTLPDERVWKDYRLEKDADEFVGYSPSKKNPYFEL